MRCVWWYGFDQSLHLCKARGLGNDIQISVRRGGEESRTSGLAKTRKLKKKGVRDGEIAPSLCSLFLPLSGTQAPGTRLDLSPKLEDYS